MEKYHHPYDGNRTASDTLQDITKEVILSFVLRSGLCLGLVLLAAFGLGGCTTKNNATVSGGAGPAAISQTGPGTGTWNRTPQGGSDEKSNSTPTKPTD